MLIGCLVVPLAPDARHLLPAVVPLVMLAAYGGMRPDRRLTTGWPTLSRLLVSMVMLLAALPALLTPLLKPPVGMIPAARAILDQGAAGPLVLVASDEKGEGALIAAIAQQDVARTAVVVPARRLLPAGPVPGMDAQGTARVLSDSAVAFVVLDAAFRRRGGAAGAGGCARRSRERRRISTCSAPIRAPTARAGAPLRHAAECSAASRTRRACASFLLPRAGSWR